MRVTTKFALAVLLWAGVIMTLIVPIAILSGGPLPAVNYVRWLGHSLALAMLPAGITIAADFEAAPRRSLLRILPIVTLAGWLVFALLGIIGPRMNDDPGFVQLLGALGGSPTDWTTHNRYAWLIALTVSETASTFLFAALGIQLAIWAARVLPVALRRTLYWAVAFGLLLFSWVATDSVYETIVIRTNGPVGYAGYLAYMLPAGLCLGLLLPTIALLRRRELA